MADSRSLSAVLAPCIGVPPARLTFAFGFGEAFRDDLVSEMSCPAADGGNFIGGGAGEMPRDFGVAAPDDVVDIDFWFALTGSERPRLALAGFDFEEPAM